MTNFTRFSQGFDVDSAGFSDETNGWSGTTTEVASGTNGLSSADGAGYSIFAQTNGNGGLTGPFSRFDYYRSVTTDQAFTSEIKIYLDPLAWAAGEGFDYSVAANGQNGSHLRDFIFHVTQDTSTGNMQIGASNNTNFDPREDLETLATFATVATADWYTFRHDFREATDGTLEVGVQVIGSGGTVLYDALIATTDSFANDFGGNRYAWFTNIDVAAGIPVDSASLATADANPVMVLNDAGLVVATFADEASAEAAIDAGTLTDTTLRIVTTGSTDAPYFYVGGSMSIQDAVDAASADDLIEVGTGTFAGANIGTAVTLFTDSGAIISGSGIELVGDIDAGGTAEVTVDGFSFENNAVGVRVASSAVLSQLTIQNANFSNNSVHGVGTGSGAPGLGAVSIINSTFEDNGTGGSNGSGDIVLFGYVGDATIQDVTINSTATEATAVAARGDSAIQIAGFDPSTYDVTEPLGSVVLDNVDVTGTYHKPQLIIQGYTDLSAASFTDVSLTGAASWGYLVFIDPVASPGNDAPGAAGYPGNFAGGAGTSELNLSGITVTNQSAANPGFDVFVRGTDADDTFTGTEANDLLNAPAEGNIDLGGDDEAFGLGGDDILIGGLGSDSLDGGEGSDTLIGGADNDVLDGGDGVDTADYSTSVAAISVNLANNPFSAQVPGTGLATGGDIGNDGLTGIENVMGGFGNDLIAGDDADNTVFASFGGDTLAGEGGLDTYDASAAASGVTVDLASGSAASANFGTDVLTSFENAVTGAGNDNVTGSADANSLSLSAGDDTVDAGAGDDVVDGGDGIDTAVFSGNRADYAVAPGTVTDLNTADGDDGTDSLSGIEVLSFADGAIFVVGAGGFATIQDAIDAAAEGDAIVVADGLYTEDLTINKGVTILGANTGVAGTDGGRTAEAIIDGQISIGATTAVTLDGFTVLNDAPVAGRSALNAVTVTGAGDHTITNTVFESTVAGGGTGGIHDVAIFTNVLASGSLTITDNLFAGDTSFTDGDKYSTAAWGRGIWHNGGGITSDISGNTFMNTRTGINVEAYDAGTMIDGNAFVDAGTGMAFGNPLAAITGVTNNTFQDVDTDLNLRNATVDIEFDLEATNNTALVGDSTFYSDNGFIPGNVAGDLDDPDGTLGVLSGNGADDIGGSVGNDAIAGDNGGVANDTLSGGAGDDTLDGAGGNDDLRGGEGDDALDGGTGVDTVTFGGNLADFDIASGDLTVTDTNAADGDEGANSLSNIEILQFADTRVLFVGEGSEFATIQSAVDAATAGDTIYIAAGVYAESVSISKALSFVGSSSDDVTVTPPSGNGFSISGDLGTDATLSVSGITFDGATSGSGIVFDTNAILGTLEVRDAIFANNSRNGLAIGGGSTAVDLDQVIVEDVEFTANGQPSGSSGDGDLLFFQYHGDATIRNVNITGADRGTGPAENAIQFRGDFGAMGDVTLENVDISGVYEKQAIGIFNYDDVDGLDATDVVITADSLVFGLSVNFDGIGGDFDLGGFDISGAPDGSALQGADDAQSITGGVSDDFLRGAGGNDTLDGGDGVDTAGYAGGSSDYAVTVVNDANGFPVAFAQVRDIVSSNGDEGRDTLTNIESVAFFGDGTVLDLGQAVKVVDAGGRLTGTFDTIQAAVDAAAAGSTVLVEEGVYREQVIIDDRAGLTIRGEGPGTIIEMPDAPVFINSTNTSRDRAAVISAENSGLISIQDLTVDARGLGEAMPSGTSPDINGIFFGNTSGSIEGVHVAGARDALNADGTPKGNQRGQGIVVANDDDLVRTVDITDSLVSDFQKNGIRGEGEGLTLNVDGTTVSGSGFLPLANAIAQNGIVFLGGTTGSITNNTIEEIGYQRGDFITAGVLTFAADDLVISGNTLTGATDALGDAQPTTHIGVYVIGESDDVVVTGNSFDELTFGIVLSNNIDNPTLSGNSFTNMFASVTAVTPDMTTFTGDNIEFYGNVNDFPVSLIFSDGIDFIVGTDFNDTLDGADGDDFIFSGLGDDVVEGGAGDDSIDGQEGNDALSGGDGLDTIIGGMGDDTMTGGAGDDEFTVNAGETGNVITDLEGGDIIIVDGLFDASDATLTIAGDQTLLSLDTDQDGSEETTITLTGRYASAITAVQNAGDGTTTVSIAAGALNPLVGTPFNDTIRGTSVGDDIQGLDGSDSLEGRDGDDYIEGGPRFDILRGGDGNDTLLGGIDGDSLRGDDGDDLLMGGEGRDNILGQVGNDTLDGGEGDDFLRGAAGNDLVVDLEGSNRLFGDAGDDTVTAGDGDDSLSGGRGNDLINAGGGNDNILTGRENDTVFGGEGNDTVFSETGDNLLNGEGGNDRLQAGIGDDTMFGGDGNDSLIGSNGDDLLDAGDGDDRIDAGGNNDQLLGREGNDFLRGGAGNDTIDGSVGDDTLDGGFGDDVFLFALGDGHDLINEFQRFDDDTLMFSGLGEDFDTAAEILAAAVQIDPVTVRIDFSVDQSVTLGRTLLADLDVSDFAVS